MRGRRKRRPADGLVVLPLKIAATAAATTTFVAIIIASQEGTALSLATPARTRICNSSSSSSRGSNRKRTTTLFSQSRRPSPPAAGLAAASGPSPVPLRSQRAGDVDAAPSSLSSRRRASRLGTAAPGATTRLASLPSEEGGGGDGSGFDASQGVEAGEGEMEGGGESEAEELDRRWGVVHVSDFSNV